MARHRLRLTVVLAGAAGLNVDVRSKVADPSSSVVASPVPAAPDGEKTRLLVPDDERMGTPAFLIVADSTGECIFKQTIVIGES